MTQGSSPKRCEIHPRPGPEGAPPSPENGRPPSVGARASRATRPQPGDRATMADLAAATETQLRNIEATTGMTIAALAAAVATRGPLPHGQIVTLLKAEYGLS